MIQLDDTPTTKHMTLLHAYVNTSSTTYMRKTTVGKNIATQILTTKCYCDSA